MPTVMGFKFKFTPGKGYNLTLNYTLNPIYAYSFYRPLIFGDILSVLYMSRIFTELQLLYGTKPLIISLILVCYLLYMNFMLQILYFGVEKTSTICITDHVSMLSFIMNSGFLDETLKIYCHYLNM